MRLVVDGMNVIGSRPDGWWRDRASARRILVESLAALAHDDRRDVTVVFDGTPQPGEEDDAVELGVTAVFAPGGPNAADDVIARLVERIIGEDAVTVVTSDGDLGRKVRLLGASVEGSSGFRARLEQ